MNLHWWKSIKNSEIKNTDNLKYILFSISDHWRENWKLTEIASFDFFPFHRRRERVARKNFISVKKNVPCEHNIHARFCISRCASNTTNNKNKMQIRLCNEYDVEWICCLYIEKWQFSGFLIFFYIFSKKIHDNLHIIF